MMKIIMMFIIMMLIMMMLMIYLYNDVKLILAIINLTDLWLKSFNNTLTTHTKTTSLNKLLKQAYTLCSRVIKVS